jgi:hypothetical protein
VTNLHCNKTKISRIERLSVSVLRFHTFMIGTAVVSFVYIKAERRDTLLATKRRRYCEKLSQILYVRYSTKVRMDKRSLEESSVERHETVLQREGQTPCQHETLHQILVKH